MALTKKHLTFAMLVPVVVAVIGIAFKWSRGSSNRGGTDRPPAPYAEQLDPALTQACEQLIRSTPESISANLGSVRKLIGTAIVRQPWIRDQFAWFELHKLEGTLIACGIRDEQARALLSMLAQSGRLRHLVQDERRELCRMGAQFSEAEAASPWTDDQRLAWDTACARILSSQPAGAAAGSAPSVPPPPSVPERSSCADELVRIAGDPTALADRTLAPDAWLSYGRALAACGPDQQPWEQLRLEGGREMFLDRYVLPFVNGDAAQGSPFQRQESQRYDQIVRDWGLEG